MCFAECGFSFRRDFVSMTCCLSIARVCTLYSYYVVAVDFEAYQGGALPRQPAWVQSIVEESSRMRLRKLPITELQIHEQFTRYFGYKRAVKLRVREIQYTFIGFVAKGIRVGLLGISISPLLNCPKMRVLYFRTHIFREDFSTISRQPEIYSKQLSSFSPRWPSLLPRRNTTDIHFNLCFDFT